MRLLFSFPLNVLTLCTTLLVSQATAASLSGGLAFDGVDDYVSFGPAPGLGSAQFTLETWFIWNGGGSPASSGAGGISVIPLIAKGRGEADGNNQDANYVFGIVNGVLGADFEEGATGSRPGLNHPVVGATQITPNEWHHAAVTFDGTNWTLYLDGKLDVTQAVGQPPRADSIQHASLGTALNSTGVQEGAFAGILDEARIWNYARAASQIASNRTMQIVSASGLVGRWSLDDTTGTTASDSSGNDQTGTLMNGPSWTDGYAFLTPPSVALTNPAQDQSFVAPANVNLVAAATDSDGQVVRVEFYQGTTKLGERTASPFSLAWNNAPVGRYSLTAVATDNSDLISTSSPVSIVIESPIVRLTSPANNSRFSAPASVALTADAVDSAGTITKVEFYSGATKVGEAASRPFSMQWSGVPAGNYLMTAVATATGGIRNTSAPVKIGVIDNVSPFVAIASPNDQAQYEAPALVPVSANAVDVDGSVTRVEFYANSFKLGEATAEPFNIAWNDVGAGNYRLVAVATDDLGNKATSAVVNITVNVGRTVMVQSNSLWRFVKGTGEASTPSDAWRGAGFDDAGWSNALAPFFYGDPYNSATDPGTLLSDMYGGAGYLSIYLRQSFMLPNSEAATNLYFVAQCDDGFIAWINGVEVVRYNMLPGETPFNGTAAGTAPEPLGVGADYITYILTDPGAYLVDGTNVLTVHAFNQSTGSSDFGFNAQLYTYLADPSLVPPRLQSVSPDIGSVFYLTNITVTFTEPVTGMNASDLLVNGNPATGVSADANNTAYTFSFPRPAYGQVAFTWAANHGIADLDATPKPFDGAAPGSTFQFTFLNPSAPTIVAQSPAVQTTVSSLSQIQVTFSENVVGVNAADLLVNGVPATGLSGSGSTYTFSFPQPPYGPVNLSWTSNHGITDTETPANPFDITRASSTWSYTLVDQTPPTVVSKNPAANASVINLTQVTVTFSEPANGVHAFDLLVNGVPATGLSGAGTTYTFSFPQPNATIINIAWANNHGITDQAGVPNNFDASAPGSTWSYQTVDNISPTLAAVTPPQGATVRQLTQIVITFNESVSGVNASDLSINNTPAQSVAGAGAGPYTFSFSAPSTGQVQVVWAASHGISDLASPPNPFVGQSWTYQLDPNARFDGAVVINEIMYHPTSERPEEEFIELHNTIADTVNLAGWRFSQGVDFTFPNIGIAGRGYLVVAANVEAFQIKYPGVTNVIEGWIGQLGNSGERVRLVNALGEVVDEVNYADQGDWGILQRGPNDGGYRGWKWFAAHDGSATNTVTGLFAGGKSLELINPAMPHNQGQNWAASDPLNGTPGQVNSSARTNIAPIISDVAHFPAVPRSTDSVSITARIRDEKTNGLIVQLFQRNHTTTSPAAFSSVAMYDDGAHGDGAANDRIFGAVLPAQASGTVVEFYVQASDIDTLTRTWPAAARQQDGTFAQTANAVYQVDDEVYGGNQPIYRIALTESDRVELANMLSGSPNSDAEMNATWITQDGSGPKIRYNASVRNRGAGTRSASPHNYRVNIPSDRKWNGLSELNLNTQFTWAQVAGSMIAQQAGLPCGDARAVQVRVNGQNQASSTGRQYGSYAFLEPISGDWAANHFPQDPNGNAYRGSIYPWMANLSYQGTDYQTYINNGYSKTSNQSENDWSDLFNLTWALNEVANDTEYVTAVRTNVNVELFMRYFAVCNLMDYRETSICRGVGDDYAMYRGAVDPRFMIVAHDFDTILGEGDTAGSTDRTIWEAADNPASGDPSVRANFLPRFMKHAEFAPVYFKELKRLCETTFSPGQINPLLEQFLSGWMPASTINNMKSFAAGRVASVLSQLPLANSVNVPLSVANGYYQTTSANVTLDGQANAIETKTIRVNGQDATFEAWQGRWTQTVTLQPGINTVRIEWLNSNGEAFLSNSVVIWYDDGNMQSVSGAIANNTTWSAANGPFNITANLTVNSGATLTIQPGTTVYLGSGVNITVANGGRILAEGTPTAPIRFTRAPGATTSWGGITINGAVGSPETRIAFAHLEYNGNTAIQSTGGTVFLDHLTFGTTTRQYISLDNSSFVVQDCVLPTPTGSFEPVHGSGGIKSGGRGIFLRNYFGAASGYNDVIDFTGGNRPGPILQVINNVFTGSGDDVLDLDSTDAWVEGNIFMHIHKNGSPDSSSAVSGGADTADKSEVTIIRNLFYDCDQAAMGKQGDFFTLLNNTIVRQTRQGGTDTDSGVVCLADEGTVEGAGMYLEGNIIVNADKLVRNQTAAVVTFTNNLMPLTWNGPGGNNSTADAQLTYIPELAETYFISWENAQVMWSWFKPHVSSPAVGSGPNGVDKGGAIAAGVSLSGVPAGLSGHTTLTLQVGLNRAGSSIPAGSAAWPNGSGYTHYQWRLDGGAWSAETSINSPINLVNLSAGAHYVEVVGKNDGALYQNDPLLGPDALITRSATWSVVPGSPAVRLNELLASNDSAYTSGGKNPDVIELYNPGNTPFSLAGLRLTDDPTNPDKYIFPAGATIPAGGYLVVLANNADGTPGYHTGFTLSKEGGSVYLYNSVGNGGSMIDSIEFGLQLTDYSIGRLANGSWALCQPTVGSVNVAAITGDPHLLKLNEWLATGWVAFPDDFIELYNPSALPVALGGLYLSDKPLGWINQHAIAPLTFIAPFGYAAFRADGNSGADHVSFSLAAEQGAIALADSELNLIDTVMYGPQHVDVAQGRTPNGADSFAFLSPTPGAPNPTGGSGSTNITTISLNLLSFTNTWRYNETEDLSAVNWYVAGYDVSSWSSGAGLLAFEDNPAITALTNTALADPRTPAPDLPTPRVYYFRTTFNVTTNLAGYAINATVRIDDGAVIYLNGAELQRVRVPDGAVSYATLANGMPTSSDAITDETFVIPSHLLVSGVNVLAAEVRQITPSSSDIVWGMAISANLSITNITGSGVVLNEVMANNTSLREPDGSTPDWIELFNQNGSPVDLSDMSLSDSTLNPRRWVFPAGVSIPANGYLRVVCDGGKPASTNAASGTLNTGFGFKASGGGAYLFDRTANGGSFLSAVNYGLQTAEFSIGRVPEGNGPWVLTLPTPNSANLAATLGNPANLKINEWMADPQSGDDWFELYNPNAQPVALGGFYLTDDLANRTKLPIPPLSFIGVAADAYLMFQADGNTASGADHANFSLKASGEALGLSSAAGVLIDAVTFSTQQTGVSEGRFPDGATNVVRFSATASPGEANYQLLANVVISEVLTHSYLPLEDAIELRNLSATPINIGGWYMSDSKSTLQKFQIPAGTMLPANGYQVFYENAFNNTNLLLSLAFGLSSANGDEVYLSAATNGILTGYRNSVIFGPAANGVSFGRYQTSVGTDFVAMSARTFGMDDPEAVEQFRTGQGTPNAYPKVGPIVISEIMYHPPEVGTNDNVIDEYIELHNTSTVAVGLYDTDYPTNTWRLRDAVDYNFPPNTVIPAGGYLVVVSFDPAADPAALEDFRNYYGLSAQVAVVGPYTGKLDNSSELIELKQPDAPEANGDVPYILVEQVRYADIVPWPAAADGTGQALARVSNNEYANDPINWLATAPTPGSGATSSLDSDSDGMLDDWELAYGLNPFNSADAHADADLDGLSNLKEYQAGTNPRDSASTLELTVGREPTQTLLDFGAAEGKAYTVEVSSSLTPGSWQTLIGVPAGSARKVRVTDPTVATSRFYRLRLQ